MSPFGSAEPKIIIVGEAPGEEEDKAGQPFIGRSGQLLRQVLGEAGVDLKTDVLMTNVVRCRPPNNKITKQAIQSCKQFAIDEIKDYQPDYVFLMGNSPLNGILGESGISNWNGSIVKKDEVSYVPLYHPAYILRDMSHMDEWLNAIFNAIEGDESEATDIIKTILPHSKDDLFAMEDYLDTQSQLYFDFETTSLDAYSFDSEIIAVALSAGDRAYAYPLNHKDADAWWDCKDTAISITKKLLRHFDGKLIGHNVKFDAMWSRSKLSVKANACGDTMLISHLLDSRSGIHGLKRLAGIYCGMYEYDNELSIYVKAHPDCNPSRGGNYGNIPLDVLLPYAAADAKATLLLNDELLPKLSDKQLTLYNELIMPASNALTTMQCNGLSIDPFLAYRYNAIYSHLMTEALVEVLEDPKVVKMSKARNAELDLSKKKHNRFVFNPGSALQLRELYFAWNKIPVLAKSKKTGAPSTSGKAYKGIEDKYPILRKVRIYKLYQKAISTYLRPASNGQWQSSRDRLVHTTMNLHGTITGRLSCSKPFNAQNIPTPEKEPGTILEYLPIKNIITHRSWLDQDDVIEGYGKGEYDDGALVSADQSGMELRVFASLANCEPMLAIHESGLDFHSMVAIMSLEHKYPDQITRDEVSWFKKNRHEDRYRYKWTNWTLLYGGDAYTLHRLYGVPLYDAEETIKMYYGLFPEVLEYREYTQEFAEDNGYIESPFGRREYLPHINDSANPNLQNKDRRAAVNMPTQSGASDTVLSAVVILDKELTKYNYSALLVNTVHDSIVGDCARGSIVKFGNLMRDVMEHTPEYAKIYMPHVDFSWLKCPLKSDVEIGTHYGIKMDMEDWIKQYGDTQ